MWSGAAVEHASRTVGRRAKELPSGFFGRRRGVEGSLEPRLYYYEHCFLGHPAEHYVSRATLGRIRSCYWLLQVLSSCRGVHPSTCKRANRGLIVDLGDASGPLRLLKCVSGTPAAPRTARTTVSTFAASAIHHKFPWLLTCKPAPPQRSSTPVPVQVSVHRNDPRNRR
jgi:hypothetical protein